MRPSRRVRRAVRERVADRTVEGRYWYWVAAVPAAFVLWLVAVAWVAVAVGLGPLAGANPLVQAARISLVAFGPPFLALVAVVPFALAADVGAVRDAEVDWQPPLGRLVAAAAIGPAVTVAIVVVDLLDGAVDVLGWAVLVGFLATVPVAAYYLLARHRRVGVP